MIGKDLFIANHKFQLKQTDDNFILLRTHGNTQTIGLVEAFSIIFCLDFGEDPFFMPDAFKCGILQSFFILSLIFVFSLLSFEVYLKTWVFGNLFSYGGITSIVFPHIVTLIIEILLIISLLAITMDYSQVITSTIIDLLSIPSNLPSVLLNRWFIYYAVSILTAFPCLFYKSISSFDIISMISNVAFIITMITFIVGFVKYRPHDISPAKLFTNNYKQTFKMIAVSSSLVFINPIISRIVISISRPTVRNIRNLIRYTNMLTFFFSLAVGVIGYYFDSNIDNITDIFPKESATFIIIKIGIIVRVICSNVCYIYLISRKLCQMILKGSEKRKLAVITSGLVVIVVNAIVQLSDFQKGFDIFQIIGLMIQTFLNFGYPTVLFLKLFQFTSKLWSFIAVLLMLCTIVICICIGFHAYYTIN